MSCVKYMYVALFFLLAFFVDDLLFDEVWGKKSFLN